MAMHDYIKSDAVNKNINIGNQTKHIRGSHNFDPGRGEIYGELGDIQGLINDHHGTGEIRFDSSGNWINKEFIELNYPVGIYRNIQRDIEYETYRFSIHYGKSGAHIVPAGRLE